MILAQFSKLLKSILCLFDNEKSNCWPENFFQWSTC